jgi:hypothetical protein
MGAHSATEQGALAVKLWTCIWMMLGSKLGRDNGYNNSEYFWFSSVSPGKFPV